jgi:poly(hydroxyalkanoate) granule-associated protein
MLKKAKAGLESGAAQDSSSLSQSVLKSSHQIWLAGLGAFAKAQTGGVKVFEGLVKQGASLEAKTRHAAAATAEAAREAATSKAKEMHAMAGGTWDKLEQVFQERVARALGQLGVYTSSDVERLTARVNELSEAVNALLKAQGVKRSPASTIQKKSKAGAKPATGAAKTGSKARRTPKKTVKAAPRPAKTAMK